MKKTVIMFIVSWIILEGSVFSWEPWWGYEYYYPYYPYYYFPQERYKPEYQSPYPAEIIGAGKLSIKITPEDAEVLLNGYSLSIREETVLGLLTGKYRIEARKKGYKNYQKEVEIKNASTINLNIILKRSNDNEKNIGK